MSVNSAAATVATPAVAGKDWSYLVDKAPTELHHDLAAYVEENSNLVDVDPKVVQAILSMHATWQKTDRIARRRRTEASIAKGGATTAVKRGYVMVNGVEVPVAEAPVEAPAAPVEAPKPARRRTAAKKPAAPKA